MITLRLGRRHVELEHAQELADAIKRQPNSCDIVWFSSLYGYPPLSVHEEAAKKMAKAAEVFRNAGIGVSMQVANTLGHGEYISVSNDCTGLVYEGSPAENIVGMDGTVSPYCFCWRGKHVREYLEASIRPYIRHAKPDVVWFDDDLRPEEHSPVMYGCFCDNCINDFNAQYGSSFTRDELVHEINYGDVKWRDRFVQFTRDGIYEFTLQMSKAIIDEEPDTILAMQHAHFCNYAGCNDDHVYKALYEAGGKAPQSRPGGSHYHDKAPLGQFAKTMRIACTNALAPDFVVERKAEVENLPDVVFGKSIGGTINESTLHLAAGCTGLTYATLMNDNEKMPWHEKMLAEFSRIRPYWERLSAVSKNAVRSGLAIYHPEAPHLRPMAETEERLAWSEIVYENEINLLITGIPMIHDQRKPTAYLLHYTMVDSLTDNDIEFLLTQPVLTDAASVQKLCERGYADRFRLEFSPMPSGCFEEFTNHEVNGAGRGHHFVESSFFLSDMPRYLVKATDDTTQVLGQARHRGEIIGDTNVLAKTFDKNGNTVADWAVFGYCVWNDIVSSHKRNQILNALDYLSLLPAKLLSCEQAAVFNSVDPKTGKTVAVTVASASQGGAEELEILVRNPAGDKLTIMSTKNLSVQPLEVEKEENAIRVKLPGLLPYELVTVFLD